MKRRINFDGLLYSILFISLLFEGISFYSINLFSITIPFVLTSVVLIKRLFFTPNLRIEIKRFAVGVTFIIIVFLVSFLSGETINYTSLALYLYYLLFFIVSDNIGEDHQHKKAINLFILIGTLFAIYSIYQFVSYNFITSLPMKELIPESLRTPGYNTIAVAYVGNNTFYRAHSIYLEPSTLSQISSMLILLIISRAIDSAVPLRKTIIPIVINLLALFLSFSGSGLIVLLCGAFYLLLGSKHFRRNLIVLVLIGFAAVFVLYSTGLFDQLLNYYSIRGYEMVSLNRTSGYYRFIVPLLAIGYIISNRWFGFGAGNDEVLAHFLNSQEHGIPNGFGKVIADFGIAGIVLFILLLIVLLPKKKSSLSRRMMFVLLVSFCICGSSILLVSFWCLSVMTGCSKIPNVSRVKNKFSRNETSFSLQQ